MSEPLDLADCADEPIHIPGSTQPHGVMFVADPTTQEISHAAGDVAGLLGVKAWLSLTLGAVLGDDLAERVAHATQSSMLGGYCGIHRAPSGQAFDVAAHRSGEHLIVELEPGFPEALPASVLLGQLDAAGAAFERAAGLKALCERAAVEFRRLTGFDRVMIYRFLDEDAGAVLAEDRAEGFPSFLNHRFPGSDIPAQARALYVRNLVRVIPDVSYRPAPLNPAWTDAAPLDMSDSTLRSVSPIHMQYLKNMGVGASASVSIVKDGALWGLVACHHAEPKLLPYDIRVGARALAGGFARQIRAKEEAESFRERTRLRGLADEFVARLGHDAHIAGGVEELKRLMDADGVAVLRAGDLHGTGSRPGEAEIRELAAWALDQSPQPFATDRLSELHPPAGAYQGPASGLLALTVSADEPFQILWFRAEQVEVVNWAGNPHKAAEVGPGQQLTPRTSFEAWREATHGRSRRWTLAETDAAQRLAQALLDLRQTRRLHELNARLGESLSETEALLQQKEFLLKEVNHRVQNSLQLVSSFLGLQARALPEPALQGAFEEARRRLSAVALVHRRLYRADQIETVDLARYLEDLIADMGESMGPEWAGQIVLDAAPVLVPTDRAVTVGLIVTELVINANKYAYNGAPGPIEVVLTEERDSFRLTVADRGRGKHTPGEGFGTRMMTAMVRQLSGALAYADNGPGQRAVLTAPMKGPAG